MSSHLIQPNGGKEGGVFDCSRVCQGNLHVTLPTYFTMTAHHFGRSAWGGPQMDVRDSRLLWTKEGRDRERERGKAVPLHLRCQILYLSHDWYYRHLSKVQVSN